MKWTTVRQLEWSSVLSSIDILILDLEEFYFYPYTIVVGEFDMFGEFDNPEFLPHF